MAASEAVKVIVRCRPLNQREKDLKCSVVVEIDQSLGQVNLVNPNDTAAPPKTFTFDGAYDPGSNTEQIYNEIVFPIVEGVTEGYNGTVFAYGQTGCGKSFSMQGITCPPTQRGIIPRAFEHIFEAIATTEHTKFLVHASYLEIYNEEIRDLLGEDVKKRLELKEHPDSGVYVNGITRHPVHDVKMCEQVMEQGWKNRSVGATLMNADSSRSHSIFTIFLEKMDTSGDTPIRSGKLNLVDLAGSERQAKTGATGDRLKEATKINLSLSALGNVISALVDGKSKHIPYRDSKLTRLLQDSLGGNTKTLMVACISPADNNYDETLSTLRYANRAKNIKNKPKINEDPKDALLREYQEEINRLKSMLQSAPPAMDVKVSEEDRRNQEKEEAERIAKKIKEEYDLKMRELQENWKREQESNQKLKEDMDKLKQTYEEQLKSRPADEHIEKDANDNHISSQEEAIERLHRLQQQLVEGGEKANDQELREKRAKKMKMAERKIAAISDALAQFDDDDQLLVKAYGDMTEELRAKTMLLKKAKRKIQALEREIEDLQSEFQADRSDYLETIRRQDQQILLLSQILEKVQPCIRRDCNYSNIDRIKSECFWDEDMQKWRLPDLMITRTKLPPATMNNDNGGMMNGQGLANANGNLGGQIQPGGRPSQLTTQTGSGTMRTFSPFPSTDRNSDPSQDRLFLKLERAAKENIAETYFKPKRREQLLNKIVNGVERLQESDGTRPNEQPRPPGLAHKGRIIGPTFTHGMTNSGALHQNKSSDDLKALSGASGPLNGLNKLNGISIGPTGSKSHPISNGDTVKVIGASFSAGEPRKPLRLEALSTTANSN